MLWHALSDDVACFRMHYQQLCSDGFVTHFRSCRCKKQHGAVLNRPVVQRGVTSYIDALALKSFLIHDHSDEV